MVYLVQRGILESSEANIARIVDFTGEIVQLLNFSHETASYAEDLLLQIQKGACLIARAEILAELIATHSSGPDALRELASRAAKCFVYDFKPSKEHNRLLSLLTSGGLSAVENIPNKGLEFSVNSRARNVCGHFSDLRLGKAQSHYDLAFVEGDGANTFSPLIQVGPRPFFVSSKKDNCEFFLVACREIADLAEPILSAAIVPFFSRLAPLLMFLYQVGGDRCWRNDSPQACLILDDPLLHDRYGFLDYRKLLRLMETEHFATSIAFIPWNYRRSSTSTVKLFQNFPHHYTLCVHGCDHTGGEFSINDLDRLCDLAQKGLGRMRTHQQLTGLGFDNVMVFPQGRFSTAAMRALECCGYLAAVNSSPFPVDLSNADRLQLRDLLLPAVTRFAGVPLFVRRYPNELADVAFDLFLGKPALLVEHHGYFRNGYGALEETIRKINQIDSRTEWSGLSTICTRACLKKREHNDDVHARFYTDRFFLRNDRGRVQRYRLSQRQMPPASVTAVSIDGVKVDTNLVGDELWFHADLAPGKTVEINVVRPRPPASTRLFQAPPMRRAAVFVRRHLSEFRDNHVDKSLLLSTIASRVRNRLVRTRPTQSAV